MGKSKVPGGTAVVGHGRVHAVRGEKAGGQLERWYREGPDPFVPRDSVFSVAGREHVVDCAKVSSVYTENDHLGRFKGALKIWNEKQFCPGPDWRNMAEMWLPVGIGEGKC